MRTVCARPGNTKSGSDPTALPVNQASYTGSTLASTTFTNIPLNARQPEPLTYSPSAWPMVPTIVRADCAPVRPIPARVKAVSSSSGSADSVNSSLTTSLVNPPSNHTRSVTIPPPPSQRGGHADGLPDLINPTPNGPASSENSLNKTSQTPKSSDGSINSNTIDPALEYSCMDMKIGTGMPVSEDARLMLQTVFRISSGPLLECYSLPKVCQAPHLARVYCVHLFDRPHTTLEIVTDWPQVLFCPLQPINSTHKPSQGLVEGLSGMRGGGVRRIKFRSDAMHSSWIRAEMQEKLAKSSNLSLGQWYSLLNPLKTFICAR